MDKYTYFNLSQYKTSLDSIVDKVSGKTAFVVARNLRLINDEVEEYRKKTEEIVRKYGEEQDDGMIRIVDPEKVKKADEEYVGISNLEISVDILKIEENDLMNTNLTAREMMAIDWMVNHPEPAPKPGAKANESLPGDADRFGI